MSAYETVSKNERLYDLTLELISDNSAEYGDRKIEKVKSLKDFDGNDYTLFELAPTGYIIYSNHSGIFYEYSFSSISPYYGYEGDLYYGSMKAYYQKVGNEFVSTVFPDEILQRDGVDGLREECKIVNERNTETKAAYNLQYIEGDISLDKIRALNAAACAKQSATVMASNPQPKISMENFFKPLDLKSEFGYRDGGVCGYIAANMVLAYNDIAYENGLVPDQYIDRTAMTLNGETLTNKLLEYGGQDPTLTNYTYPGTDANSMGDIVRAFIKGESEISLPWNITTWWFAINANGAIDKNQPPILFGNYNPPSAKSAGMNGGARGAINHAVVAYGRTSSFWSTAYRVHYGWGSYSDVNLSYNAIGTTMILSYF